MLKAMLIALEQSIRKQAETWENANDRSGHYDDWGAGSTAAKERAAEMATEWADMLAVVLAEWRDK